MISTAVVSFPHGHRVVSEVNIAVIAWVESESDTGAFE